MKLNLKRAIMLMFHVVSGIIISKNLPSDNERFENLSNINNYSDNKLFDNYCNEPFNMDELISSD